MKAAPGHGPSSYIPGQICQPPGPKACLELAHHSPWLPVAVGVSKPSHKPAKALHISYSFVSVLGPGDLLLVARSTESETGRGPGPPAAQDWGSGPDLVGGSLPAPAGGFPFGPWAARVSTSSTGLVAGPTTTEVARAPRGRRAPMFPGQTTSSDASPPSRSPGTAMLPGQARSPGAASECLVYSQCHPSCKKGKILLGRMLGYLFFSLFSSLLASSKVPCMCPDGND